MSGKFLKHLKKGGGEVIGFMCTMPALVLIIVTIISVIRIGIIRENLEYAAYAACRAAVVCEKQEVAEAKAELAAKLAMRTSKTVYKKLETKLEVVTADPDAKSQWTKGNYVRCDVSVYVKTPLLFGSGKRTGSITLMIERPADDGFSMDVSY